MNTKKLLGLSGLCGLAAALVIGLLFILQPSHPAPPHIDLPPITIHQAAPVETPEPESAGQPASDSALVPAPPRSPPASVEYVNLRFNQPLASVNGIVITLKDLIPAGADELATEKTMSLAMYEFLLQRAIDRELAFQRARRSGVQLGGAEIEQLKQLRASLAEGYPGYRMLQPTAVDIAKIEFEARDAEGLMIQDALMGKAGRTPPHIDEAQVQEYYRNHSAEFGLLPTEANERRVAWQKIDFEIRQKLEEPTRAEHEKQRRQYLGELREQAAVETATLLREQALALAPSTH